MYTHACIIMYAIHLIIYIAIYITLLINVQGYTVKTVFCTDCILPCINMFKKNKNNNDWRRAKQLATVVIRNIVLRHMPMSCDSVLLRGLLSQLLTS